MVALQTEAELQADIAKLFRYMACEVLTIHTTARCRMGHAARVFGASQGKPDLFIRSRKWPPRVWLALEIKRDAKAPYSSDEQRRLCESGAIARVWSVEMALDAYRTVDALWGLVR